MQYRSLDDFLENGKAALVKGPVAMVFVEDLIEVETTLVHHQMAGFETVILFAPTILDLPDQLEDEVYRVDYDTAANDATQTAVNAIIEAAPGLWLYYCYNGEYLFHPFCEDRTIGEMLTFQTEERRDAVLTYVIDLYAEDLNQHPNAVSLEHAWLDKSGYYALGRGDPKNGDQIKERQLDFFGGLRWRFEEHIPASRRKIDRISLFRAKKGLLLREDHTFNDEEYNTFACPWHNNITTAIVSFRTAKALKSNAGSTFDIHSFKWHNSTEFKWNSQQLLDLGLMEPGQWF